MAATLRTTGSAVQISAIRRKTLFLDQLMSEINNISLITNEALHFRITAKSSIDNILRTQRESLISSEPFQRPAISGRTRPSIAHRLTP